MSVSFVKDFKTKVGSVQNVSPSIDYLTITCNDRLIEIKSIQIERHCRNTQSSEPNANNWPSGEKEVKAATVIKRSILKDKATEVTVSSDNIICLLLLTKLVTIVM